MAIAKNKTPGVVPRLRFPGFTGAWESVPVLSLYEFKATNSLSRDKLNYEQGDVRNIHYGDIHTQFSARFILSNESVPYINNGEEPPRLDPESFCIAGDMVFADASEDLADIGKSIEIIDLNDERVLAGMHTILARRAGNELVVGFGSYLFRSSAVRNQIQREAQGAKVLGISPKRLGDVLLRYPDKHKEQQKIADCLSSLDACISAEIRRFDALKAYKQGLMQQLFPVEGQYVPRLRFSGFERDWEEKAISDFGEVVTGNTPSTTRAEYYGGEYLFASPADISDLRFVETTKTRLTDLGFAQTRQIEAGSVLFVCIGSTIGKVAQNLVRCATNQQINSIVPSISVSGDFLYYLLSRESERIAKLAGSHAVPIINKSMFAAVTVLSPELAEQQKIATCLASVDERIALQSRKVFALQRHKKGLMQGLFPTAHRPAAED